ncbi:MAG: DNA polymerase IV [Tissierellia bacterium]|nr:DNA polymerase IV [Tissierellia bacterium]
MKKILHADLDAFYASVESLDDPSLVGKPLAVGGRTESSIITTASYEARKYGIHSAMPVYTAKKLCPQLILKPVRRGRYQELSRQVFSIYRAYSPAVEKVSIDEAYLDFTGHKEAKKKALDLQKEVYQRTGLSLSCGLSYNKFLAKLASDWNKPQGFKAIWPDQVPHILKPLPVGRVHGIGQQSEKKLVKLGIETVGDLLEVEEDFLVDQFGKGGREIYKRIRGIDPRKIETHRVRKSLGTEETFAVHTRDQDWLLAKLRDFSRELDLALEKKGFLAHTLTVKVRDVDFKTRTKSQTFEGPIRREEDIYPIARDLFLAMKIDKKLRLLGITLSNLSPEEEEQLYFL